MNPIVPLLLSLQIVFCGDSLTKGWETYNLFDANAKVYVNGVKSCTSADVLARISEIAKRQPHKVFLMVGVNEIDAPDRIVANHKRIISEIQKVSPYTRIYVQSILPTRVSNIDNAVIMETNRRLKALCLASNEFVKFINLYDAFAAEDGKLGPNFTEDGIHLTKNAYSLWKKLIISQI